eukprot:605391-Prymnesium_polylepis.1
MCCWALARPHLLLNVNRRVQIWPLEARKKLVGAELSVATHHPHELAGAQRTKLDAEVNMLSEALSKCVQARSPAVSVWFGQTAERWLGES